MLSYAYINWLKMGFTPLIEDLKKRLEVQFVD